MCQVYFRSGVTQKMDLSRLWSRDISVLAWTSVVFFKYPLLADSDLSTSVATGWKWHSSRSELRSLVGNYSNAMSQFCVIRGALK